ncbi:MAG: hypothetical protein AAGH79_02315 [Bacteroidota bacterium]
MNGPKGQTNRSLGHVNREAIGRDLTGAAPVPRVSGVTEVQDKIFRS